MEGKLSPPMRGHKVDPVNSVRQMEEAIYDQPCKFPNTAKLWILCADIVAVTSVTKSALKYDV